MTLRKSPQDEPETGTTIGKPHPTRCRDLRDLAILQSFRTQVQAALVLFGECLEDGAQLLLRLAERKLFFCVVARVRMAGQDFFTIQVSGNRLVCSPPLQRKVVSDAKKPAIEVPPRLAAL